MLITDLLSSPVLDTGMEFLPWKKTELTPDFLHLATPRTHPVALLRMEIPERCGPGSIDFLDKVDRAVIL